jgi:predicted deacetylase
MFASRYLVRFDDICPTMNWRIWAEIESCLRAHGVRPIMAIVAKNRDSKLVSDIARRDFWERVREWQALGWSIGLHGYEHRMVTTSGGIVGINLKSEFAGLPLETQYTKLQQAVQIFREEGVRPEVWVGPWHSFDSNTLTALQRLGINCISDGLGLHPWRDKSGVLWVPQQQWRFRRMPLGLWTVCYHHNQWRRGDLDKFFRDIATFSSRISSLDEVRRKDHGARSALETLSGVILHRMLAMRQLLMEDTTDPQAEENRYFE